MPLIPIYEGDVIVMQVERQQRRELALKCAHLSKQLDKLEKKVDAAPSQPKSVRHDSTGGSSNRDSDKS